MISCLLVVDMQNDFMPTGALPVPSASTLVQIINNLMAQSELVFASLDWHPPHHVSFASEYPNKNPGDILALTNNQQILWPEHCVANSPGAELVSGLRTDLITNFIYKGTDKLVDSYSAFFDNNKQKSTDLDKLLKTNKVKKIFICGVALDYCVFYSAIDAVHLGYETYLILDACKGVGLNNGDIENALANMINAGVKITTVQKIREQKKRDPGDS